MADETKAVDESKPWYLSKGVIGSLIVVGTAICKVAGIDIDIDIEGMEEELLTIVGGVVALWGRIAAAKRLR